MRSAAIAAGSILVLLALAGAPAAVAAPAGSSSCFFPSQWQGWKAPDAHTIYLHVGLHDIYRLRTKGACPALLSADAHLVNRIRGASTICSPLDFDLDVADSNGFRSACIIDSMTRLSPAEAAAIPPKLRP